MTAGAPTATTDEQFLCSVYSPNVIDADAALWKTLETFLGRDPVDAWTLVEVTHEPRQDRDEDGKPVGDPYLASTATFKRDPTVPTPPIPITIAQELPELPEGGSAAAAA
jgi:hypothetical protein